MKKRFSLLLCMIALMSVLTGCVTKENVSYDEATIQSACENVFALISSESISEADLNSLSDWNQGYLMASLESQLGVQMDVDTLVTAIQGWDASLEECGAFIEYGSTYEFTATSSKLTVTVPAVYSERKADLEFVFDENLKLDSFTVSAKYSTGEILEKAGLNTVLGMGTVFAVLIFMSFIISLLKYIPMFMDKLSKKKTAEQPKEKVVIEEAIQVEASGDDTELVAVIAAAIAAAEGTSTDDFVVRSIKRRKSNKWNA